MAVVQVKKAMKNKHTKLEIMTIEKKDIEIKNQLGGITLSKLKKDHLGRVLLEIQISDKYIYQRLEEVEATIKALQERREEMIKSITSDKEEREENEKLALPEPIVGWQSEQLCGKPNCTRQKLENSPLCSYHWDIANS